MISYQHLSELKQLYIKRALGTVFVDPVSIESSNEEEKASLPENISALHKVIAQCHLCDLCKTRSKVQVHVGHPTSGVMIVSDFPTPAEDSEGAYSAKAGKMLKLMIEKVLELPIEDVYFTHLVKCLPPSGKEPTRSEVLSCTPFINQQIELLSPKLIIALGDETYRNLTHSKESFDQIHGIITPFNGYKIVAIHHPKVVVRNPTALKPIVFNDLKTIKSFLCEN